MSTSQGTETTIVCATCGRRAESQADARLRWSRSVTNGRVEWTCETCSRDNVRSIESKLDPAWW